LQFHMSNLHFIPIFNRAQWSSKNAAVDSVVCNVITQSFGS
jgi:hypothetical protein